MAKMNKLKEEDTKIFKSLNSCSVKCKHCNKTVVISRFDKRLCENCGHYVYKDAKTEFMYRMQEQMIRNKRGE